VLVKADKSQHMAFLFPPSTVSDYHLDFVMHFKEIKEPFAAVMY